MQDQDVVDVKSFFVDQYGGSSVDGPSEGYWKDDSFAYQDANLEFSIFIPEADFQENGFMGMISGRCDS